MCLSIGYSDKLVDTTLGTIREFRVQHTAPLLYDQQVVDHTVGEEDCHGRRLKECNATEQKR